MDGALVLLLLDGLAISWNSAKVNLSHSHQISECMTKHNYHASNSHECTVNGKALQLRAAYTKPYFCYKSHQNSYQYYKSSENPYQVLQVTCAQNVYETKIVAVC